MQGRKIVQTGMPQSQSGRNYLHAESLAGHGPCGSNAAMTALPAPPVTRSKTLRLWLIIGSVVAVLAVFPAVFMGMMSVMASDAGTNGWIEAFIYTSLTFPVAIVAGPVLAWVAYAFRRERLSWGLLFSPFAWAFAILLILIVGPGQS